MTGEVAHDPQIFDCACTASLKVLRAASLITTALISLNAFSTDCGTWTVPPDVLSGTYWSMPSRPELASLSSLSVAFRSTIGIPSTISSDMSSNSFSSSAARYEWSARDFMARITSPSKKSPPSGTYCANRSFSWVSCISAVSAERAFWNPSSPRLIAASEYPSLPATSPVFWSTAFLPSNVSTRGK